MSPALLLRLSMWIWPSGRIIKLVWLPLALGAICLSVERLALLPIWIVILSTSSVDAFDLTPCFTRDIFSPWNDIILATVGEELGQSVGVDCTPALICSLTPEIQCLQISSICCDQNYGNFSIRHVIKDVERASLFIIETSVANPCMSPSYELPFKKALNSQKRSILTQFSWLYQWKFENLMYVYF